MDTIRFANGDVYSCPYCVSDSEAGTAFVALDEVTFAEAAVIFSDSNMTAEMEYYGRRLIGYTDLKYLMKESYGIKAFLAGGHDERGE